MKSLSLLLRAVGTAALLISFASCTENLDSSAVCKVLCPAVGGEIQNITLDAVVLDTTVQSLSGLGTEPALLLASRGDTLDARVIVRFDSLPTRFTPVSDTSRLISSVDSAYILFKLDTLTIKGTGPVTIEAYDVDTAANDTLTAAVLALFRPDRFISSQTFTRAQLTDSLKYYISNATVLAKIQSRQRLRVGLRATGPSSTQLRFFSTEGGISPDLFFRATPDTVTKPLNVIPFSRTPVGESIAAVHLSDYTIIAKGPTPASPFDLAVGGLPPRRAYFRFDIPRNLVDSSIVVRATLLLNQIPSSSIDPTEVVKLIPGIVLAGAAVKDPAKASQISTDIALDTLSVTPGGSGLAQVELANAFAIWRTQSPDSTPRAIILRSINEGNSPLEIIFSSSEAAASLRPRLRISFTPRVPLGLP